MSAPKQQARCTACGLPHDPEGWPAEVCRRVRAYGGVYAATRSDPGQAAPEQQAAPVQPPADLRQRIDATIRPRMLIGLQDAELYDEPGRERIGEWADSITSWVMAEIEPELAALREQLAAAQTENARLRAELAEARGHAELYGRKLVAALAARNES